jgi:hypothetical protein
MEQQTWKVELTSISMLIILPPNKIKLQAFARCVWKDGHNNQPIENTKSVPYFVLPKTYLGGKVETTKPTMQYHFYYLFPILFKIN